MFNFILLHQNIQLFQYHMLKWLLWAIELSWYSLRKSFENIIVALCPTTVLCLYAELLFIFCSYLEYFEIDDSESCILYFLVLSLDVLLKLYEVFKILLIIFKLHYFLQICCRVHTDSVKYAADCLVVSLLSTMRNL